MAGPPTTALRYELKKRIEYAQDDSDAFSFQLVFAAILWVKLSEMFVTVTRPFIIMVTHGRP